MKGALFLRLVTALAAVGLAQGQGEDLCAVDHSLASQSLILRPSYGNIFSVTTPDMSAPDVPSSGGVETIAIKTLSLRMADFQPDLGYHFEVWVYTGSGDNIELNSNDLDDDPTNDNRTPPSKGEYQSSRAKLTEWSLIAEGAERELIPDTDFFDHNGHIFNVGAENDVSDAGPLGPLTNFDNMEDVSLAAAEWNAGQISSQGSMNAYTADGESTETYFYKIPEEMFTTLKLPKYNGKATLFVTLDRVALQYGYAAKQEFDEVDVTKQDYIDQTPSLDVLNGGGDLRVHVGEGVIFYPWMEEEFFYQTRRFLGKVWYDALIPCERDAAGGEPATTTQQPTTTTTQPATITVATTPIATTTKASLSTAQSPETTVAGPSTVPPVDVGMSGPTGSGADECVAEAAAVEACTPDDLSALEAYLECALCGVEAMGEDVLSLNEADYCAKWTPCTVERCPVECQDPLNALQACELGWDCLGTTSGTDGSTDTPDEVDSSARAVAVNACATGLLAIAAVFVLC